MNKPVKVVLLDQADEEYKRLNGIVGQQMKFPIAASCGASFIFTIEIFNQIIKITAQSYF